MSAAKIIKGRVVSTKQDKTVVVKVETPKLHKVYGKRYVMHKKYHAHYEGLSLKVGDYVQMVEIPPKSKKKCWMVKNKIK